MRKIITHLSFYVLIAIVLGILLGVYFPSKAIQLEPLAKGFIQVIKLFTYPIIFLTVTLGIASMGDLKKVGRIGLVSLVYFEIVSTISLAIGVLVALWIQPGNIDKSGLQMQDPTKYTSATNFDLWGIIASNTNLQILLLAILVGFVLNYLPKREQYIHQIGRLTHYVFLGLKWVMYFAPLGALGGMSYAIGKYGLATLLPLGKLMVTMYVTMALFVFVILGLILRYFKLSIFKLLRNIKEELLIVFATSSSEPAMPSLMNKLEKMGCSKSVVGLVVPTGYSFNLDGTSIYLSMAVIFIAQLYNVHLSTAEIVTMLLILMLTSKGAAGVTGSGFIVLASTLATMQKIPMEGLAFLLGVDKFMSEARAITNIIGNSAATIVIAKTEGETIKLD
ncbi:MAG: cation:dicarboxylase symporter family transporter [Sediminibacterium sp.]|nr:cation:dicarboxylase symporter family transporter [Sediminibacterium sp.]MBP6145475.1 cation:dicarboxylase symporter family transporter [Sediminibacterium sp.]